MTVSALREAYGFDEVEVGERLEGGYANDLYRVAADGRALVLRLMHPPVDRDGITWEHAQVRVLAGRLAEVEAPLRARNGATLVAIGDRIGCLMPFVDGATADESRAQDRAAAAGALGRLHRAAGELAVGQRPGFAMLSELAWPPLRVPAELSEWGALIAEARAWAISFVAEVAAERRLRTSVIHGDYFPGNLLLADGEAVAIIDWEEAHVDWVTWDLAAALGTFSSVGDDLDRGACEEFCEAYREAGGTADERDDDLLIPLARVKRILEVLRAPTDRHPRWDHQRRNLRSLERLGG